MRNAQADAENAGQIVRCREGSIAEPEGGKSRRGRAAKKRYYDDRTRNVYENKQKDDNLPDATDDISTLLHDILTKDTRLLHKPSALSSLIERRGTKPALQNVETRAPGLRRGLNDCTAVQNN
jgi:hypothetical protein